MSRDNGRRMIDEAVASRRRALMISGMRGLARARSDSEDARTAADQASERCDLCGLSIPDDHRHLLALVERRIVCSCEACWAMRAGEGDYRPTGNRTVWLPDLDVPDDLWASFQIPIGLAFFMNSTVTSCVVAMYPSPAGATESLLPLTAWEALAAKNPDLRQMQPDVEALLANRVGETRAYFIAPIDKCYELVGTIRKHWKGLSGGEEVWREIDGFFAALRE